MSSTPDSRTRALADFASTWGEPAAIVRAPGRVNLIGEHTDYNDGFVLPMAIPFDTVLALGPAPDGVTTLRAEGYGTVAIGAGDPPEWARYVTLMHDHLTADGIVAPAWVATVATDIPTGASLSSSAAIEVVVGLAIAHGAGVEIDPVDVARYGQQVETELLGAPTGIMDQLISATAEAGSASLIDCRSLERRACPIPAGSTVVVMDTTTRRRLVDSEFSERMASCRRAAELLGVRALRDTDDVSALEVDHPLEWRRAAHVVAENRRTLEAAEAMAAGDAVRLGALMADSHASLRDLYEVSGPALDLIVEIASAAPGCFGARMTGGGFAGCAVALVATAELDGFLAAVDRRYTEQHGTPPQLWPCDAAPGASVEPLG